ncbi:MAG: BNR-4 repeat-containing protein [Planctomycetes bacterium]|nr:BNR-4 repeat-containing protein [Planctomycetota bacterium]
MQKRSWTAAAGPSHTTLPVTPSSAFKSCVLITLKVLVLLLTCVAHPLLCAAAPQPADSGAPFDGETNSIRVDRGERFNLMPLTLSVWVSLNDYREPQVLFNRGSRAHLFTLYMTEARIVFVTDRAHDVTVAATAQRPPLRTWTHLAATYDGKHLVLYINGRPAASQRAPAEPPLYKGEAGKAPLFVGAEAEGLNPVSGRMADARIYDIALTPVQVQAAMAGREPAPDHIVLKLSGEEMRQQMRSDKAQGRPIRYIANGELPTADGFRGLWYANQPSADEYKFKYSGGLATYPQQHTPIAVYRPQVQKTFFVYGGRSAESNVLLHMVSYYDHAAGKLARPRVLLNKRTSDAHDNPTLLMDEQGHLWIFSNAHGSAKPSYIHRSRKPYDITAFDHVLTTNFSYGQPWRIDGHGFVFLHTRYSSKGRVPHVSTSANERDWSAPRPLADIDAGHYQVSWPHGKKLGTAFNYHPADAPSSPPLNWRTNLYYMETHDGGKTWQNVQGQMLDLPLTEPDNPALAVEFWSKKTLVYLKNVQYTGGGRPVVLFLNSRGYEAGPKNDPRTLRTARWTGSEWEIRDVTTTDNNYDFATLYIEEDGAWRVIGTTEPGPQRYNTGGEVAMWLSQDQGRNWRKVEQLTRDSEYNHTYPRQPLDAHPDFYALWADGHAREESMSRLYFCTRDGQVFRMPPKIEGDAELVDPEPIEASNGS